MGQSVFKDIPVEFAKEAQIVKELAVLSYDEFLDMVTQLNAIFQDFMDESDKRLLFALKADSHSTIFWKGTVRVICYRRLASNEVEDQKELNLKEFLQAYKMILHHIKPLLETRGNLSPSETDGAAGKALHRADISTSMIMKTLTQVDKGNEMEECCICMERIPEVTLPCAHSYCLFCIEQWNVSHKTCPVCREGLESTEDSWVLPEIPGSSEVSAELQRALSGFASKIPDDS